MVAAASRKVAAVAPSTPMAAAKVDSPSSAAALSLRYSDLFRYAGRSDWVLFCLGTFGALGTGAHAASLRGALGRAESRCRGVGGGGDAWEEGAARPASLVSSPSLEAPTARRAVSSRCYTRATLVARSPPIPPTRLGGM